MKIRVSRKPANAYQHGNLREALVQAGLKLLSEVGVAGLSLRAAAQLAGVSHAAPYRHFKDKEALVAAVAEQGFRLLTASMRAATAQANLDPTSPTRARLLALGRGYLRFAVEHPAYLQVIFGGVLAKEIAPPPELQAAGAEAYAELRDCVATGLERGELRGGDPDKVALTAWSLVHGLAQLTGSKTVDPASTGAPLPDFAEQIVTLLLEGIESPPKAT